MAKIPAIQFKRSHVPGRIPAAADLAVGEIAINMVDQKLYTKDSDGFVIPVGGAGGGILAVDSEGVLQQLDSDDVKQKEVVVFDILKKRLLYWDSDADSFLSLGESSGGIITVDSEGALAALPVTDTKQKEVVIFDIEERKLKTYDSETDSFVSIHPYDFHEQDFYVTAIPPAPFVVTDPNINVITDSEDIFVMLEGFYLTKEAYDLTKVAGQWQITVFADAESPFNSIQIGDWIRVATKLYAAPEPDTKTFVFNMEDESWTYQETPTQAAAGSIAYVFYDSEEKSSNPFNKHTLDLNNTVVLIGDAIFENQSRSPERENYPIVFGVNKPFANDQTGTSREVYQASEDTSERIRITLNNEPIRFDYYGFQPTHANYDAFVGFGSGTGDLMTQANSFGVDTNTSATSYRLLSNAGAVSGVTTHNATMPNHSNTWIWYTWVFIPNGTIDDYTVRWWANGIHMQSFTVNGTTGAMFQVGGVRTGANSDLVRVSSLIGVKGITDPGANVTLPDYLIFKGTPTADDYWTNAIATGRAQTWVKSKGPGFNGISPLSSTNGFTGLTGTGGLAWVFMNGSTT